MPALSETVTICTDTDTFVVEPEEPHEPPEPDSMGGGMYVAIACVVHIDSVTVMVIIIVSVTETVSTCVYPPP